MAEGKGTQFIVRCTEEEKERLKQAATEEKLSVSAWIRRTCLLAADQILGTKKTSSRR